MKKKILFFLIVIIILILILFLYFKINYKKNKKTNISTSSKEEFIINKLHYYSTANAISNTTNYQNPEWNLKVYQYTDIAIYLDRLNENVTEKNYIMNFEILNINDDIKELIMNGASSIEIKKKALQKDFTPLVIDGIQKVLDGFTTIEELNKKLVVF